jgi:hypothetical protein
LPDALLLVVIVNYVTIFGVPFAVMRDDIVISIINNDVNYFTQLSNNIPDNGLNLIRWKFLQILPPATRPL